MADVRCPATPLDATDPCRGRFSFASDYVRFKVLEGKAGSIWTRMWSFARALSLFFGSLLLLFEFVSFLSTCFDPGAEPGHPLIRAILGKFDHMDGCQVSNIYWTRHMIDTYRPASEQSGTLHRDGIRILPRNTSSYRATARRDNYARHHAKERKPGGGVPGGPTG